MNPDTITTIMGCVVAAMTALGTYNAPEGVPTWLRIGGYVVAAAVAVMGYFTNKLKKPPSV